MRSDFSVQQRQLHNNTAVVDLFLRKRTLLHNFFVELETNYCIINGGDMT